MILALDCATKTGWCLWDDGKVYESGVQDFTKQRGESNGMMFIKFRSWLKKILTESGVAIDLMVYEQAHHKGGAATEICVNLTGRVQEVGDVLNIQYTSVHSQELKKWALGDAKRGNKDRMIEKAATVLGRPPKDDNEADAVLIAKWASENYGG